MVTAFKIQCVIYATFCIEMALQDGFMWSGTENARYNVRKTHRYAIDVRVHICAEWLCQRLSTWHSSTTSSCIYPLTWWIVWQQLFFTSTVLRRIIFTNFVAFRCQWSQELNRYKKSIFELKYFYALVSGCQAINKMRLACVGLNGLGLTR